MTRREPELSLLYVYYILEQRAGRDACGPVGHGHSQRHFRALRFFLESTFAWLELTDVQYHSRPRKAVEVKNK